MPGTLQIPCRGGEKRPPELGDRPLGTAREVERVRICLRIPAVQPSLVGLDGSILPMRILILEDYQPLRSAMEQRCREAGYVVDAAADGDDALYFLKANSYAVAVLDLMVPGASGLEVLRAIREQGSRTAVILVTARDAVDDRVAGLDAGADDYLAKPFAMDELMARIRSLVRRTFEKHEAALRVGDLELDPRTHQVTRGGSRIELTAREYALLELLMLRSGELVSRSDVWEQLYEFGEEAVSNVVDVFIRNLRRKIERPDAPKLIHTKRGEGYILELRDE